MADVQEQAGMNPEIQGIYMGLWVNDRARSTRTFFNNLPPSYGTPVDTEFAHITMLDVGESAIEVATPRDKIALHRTEREIAEHLGHLPLAGMTLLTEGDRLIKLSKHLVAPVVKTAFLEDLRGKVGDIVEKELGETIGDIDKWVPHMSVTRLRRTKPTIRPHKPQMPPSLHIRGHIMGPSLDLSPGSRRTKNTTTKFVNRPGARR